jgi:CHASE2 domain-containing sensor protein
VQALILALLAIGFFSVARRTSEMRLGWLISGSVAAGLAIAATINLIQAAVTPAVPAAGAVIFAAIMVFAVHMDRGA